jgi:hypothetical protein
MYKTNDKLEFENIDAWGFVEGLNIVILKHKKSLGKFAGVKVRIDIYELPAKERK